MGKHLENHAKIIHNQRTEGGIEPGTPLPVLRWGGGGGGGVPQRGAIAEVVP